MTDALTILHPTVYLLARQAQAAYPYRSVPGYADEAWAWIKAHPDRVTKVFEEDEESQWKRLERSLERYLERVGRAEKAAAAGYKAEDETFYPKSLVELALPSVWDEAFMQGSLLSDQAGDGEDGKHHLPPKRVSDPAEGNNWLATCVDVRQAYNDAYLSGDQRWWLYQRYAEHRDVDAIARAEGLGEEYLEHQLSHCLRKIQRQLGGERPARCGSSCECRGSF